MTPDEVVTRARELEGREVLLTVRGMVSKLADRWLVIQHDGGYTFGIVDGNAPRPYLADIQPAPMRVVAGQLYRNSAGELLRGDADGGLTGFDGYIPPDAVRHDSDLKPVKVVDA